MNYTFGDVTVACTNVDRIIFPDANIAKGEMIAYYNDVASVMVPELIGRPLTVERFTKGIDKGGFFQKHAQKHFPPWIERVELGGKTRVNYPICNSQRDLVYFANQGAVAFHIWTSRKDAPDRPDLIVFDLDPPDGKFDLVRSVARLLHDQLDAIGLGAFVKTTGSKGLHVVAPLDGEASYADVMELTTAIAKRMCELHPELVTVEFYKKDRKGRLYFDTMRNAMGATFVAAYSLRGKPGAPVSTPITWAELAEVTSDAIHLRDVRARLDKRGDAWAKLRAKPGSVAAALARLTR
jgi:bifunctional non-homologous end joining protein LigD